MWKVKYPLAFAMILSTIVGGCGLYVPQKNLGVDDTIPTGKDPAPNPEVYLENRIIAHVNCELESGLWKARNIPNTEWLTKDWGAQVTLAITAQETGSLNPGVSFITPFDNSVRTFPHGGNVTTPQSFTFGIGASGSANATRTETIAYTLSNKGLLNDASIDTKSDPGLQCDHYHDGTMVQSDLKIAEFIYDKASLAVTHELTTGNPSLPLLDTFQDQLTFVASFSANATPVWKFATISANNVTPLANAGRISTNLVTITLGEYIAATKTTPAKLSTAAQNLNAAGVNAGAIGTQNQAQAPH
jgi:hypothetical protein